MCCYAIILKKDGDCMQTYDNKSLSLRALKTIDICLNMVHNNENVYESNNERIINLPSQYLETVFSKPEADISSNEIEAFLDEIVYIPVEETYENQSKTAFRRYALFSAGQATQEKDGSWRVSLIFNNAFTRTEDLDDFTSFLLKYNDAIQSFSISYSIKLFAYLYNNKDKGVWDITVKELKSVLNCSADTYNDFGRFNNAILNKCHKEITEKTNFKYMYSPIKEGRSVKKIQFTISDPDTSS